MKNTYTPQRWALLFCCLLSLFSFNGFAQVGIGTTNPDADAILDVTSTVAEPGGLLLPRVLLTGTANTTPLANHVAGMTVYNTATAGNVTPGYYYNDGGQWVRIAAASVPSNDWTVLGNAGLNATNNFLGTTDNINLRFRTSNTDAFEISSGNATNRGKLRAMTNGTAALPVYSWTSDTDMGLYRIGTDILGFSTAANESMRILADRRIAVNTTAAIANTRLTVLETGANRSIFGNSVTGEGIRGESTSGDGVIGLVTTGRGVYGQATSGIGVSGTSTTANARGGNFINTQANGFGLWALGGGATYQGFLNTGTGAMITGRAFGTTSFATGVDGEGIIGVGDNLGRIPARPLGLGVVGYGYQAGVFGDSGYYGQSGVYGSASGDPGITVSGTGVFGENVGFLGVGVAGESTNIGVSGYGAYGGVFEAVVDGGFGAVVENTTGVGANRIGLVVSGQNVGITTLPGTGAVLAGDLSAGAGFAENATGTGLIGVGNNLTTANTPTVGSGVSGTGNTVGVYGKGVQAADGVGVIGLGNALGTYNVPAGNIGAGVAGTGINIGVFGHATDPAGYGVYSSGNLLATGDITTGGDITATGDIAGNGFAFTGGDLTGNGFSFTGGDMAVTGDGAIGGDLVVTGDLTASGTKAFTIDDPRDPANKYLKHFSIESNEILNLYRGVITFDASGEAVVKLPDYYDAINRNASYQLTSIGAAMPNLYIATEINNGIFIIAGGVPGKKVSWTLTAERNDPYIQTNPEVRNVVVDKGAERGRYLAPEVYGQSTDQGIVNNRISKIQNASISTVAKQAIGSQEMLSKAVEATKLDSKQARNLTTQLKTRRTESSGDKVLRDVPLTKAEKVEASNKAIEQVGQNAFTNEVQGSEVPQQTSESDQAPAKIKETQDNK